MGSREGEGDKDEHPQREVYLDGFWMDKTPVTVSEYRRFCEATGRTMPEQPEWGWQGDHPIVCLNYHDATEYARWMGKRLPTEAEWEKAARGTDGRIYPWGNGEPDAGGRWRCNVRGEEDGFEFTSPVGSFPMGASPYGCLDMTGNVEEWCADWCDLEYYSRAPDQNPRGPLSGEKRVMRGGSWSSGQRSVRCTNRFLGRPSWESHVFGFRCAMDSK